MDGEAAATYMVAAGEPRACHSVADPVIEGAALLPEPVVPAILPFGIVGTLVVDIVPRLSQDGHALLGELPEPIGCLAHEIRVIDDLVVIQEDDSIEPQRVRYHQS